MLELVTERLEERIFQWVVVEGSSAAKIAGDLSLQEDDVLAICEKQRRRATRRQTPPPSPGQQLMNAWDLHLRRLEFLYQTVMGAWEASAAERGVVHQKPGNRTEVKCETQQGKAYYLVVAAKLSREQALAETALAKLRAQGESEVDEGNNLEHQNAKDRTTQPEAKRENLPPASVFARGDEIETTSVSDHAVGSDELKVTCVNALALNRVVNVENSIIFNPVRARETSNAVNLNWEVRLKQRRER
jgi:hypothetical protein